MHLPHMLRLCIVSILHFEKLTTTAGSTRQPESLSWGFTQGLWNSCKERISKKFCLFSVFSSPSQRGQYHGSKDSTVLWKAYFSYGWRFTGYKWQRSTAKPVVLFYKLWNQRVQNLHRFQFTNRLHQWSRYWLTAGLRLKGSLCSERCGLKATTSALAFFRLCCNAGMAASKSSWFLKTMLESIR